MFKNCKNSNIKGNVGFGRAVAYFTLKGYIVSIPLNDSQDYDLIVDKNRLYKIQVKTTSQKTVKGNYKVKIEQCSHNYSKHFENNKTDYLFILCENGLEYLIPSKDVKVKTLLTLTTDYDKYKI